MTDDLRLIRRIVRRGSRRAADELVRAHYDAVFAFVWRQIGDRQQAMNLTQETFIAMLGALATYDSGKASFTTWLYRIAAYKVIDVRRRRGVPTVPLPEGPGARAGGGDSAADAADGGGAPPDIADERMPDPASLLAHRDLLNRIEDRVRDFDPAVQETYRLHLYAGQTFTEIAAVTGAPESTVKARWFRLMKTIRKEFGDERADTVSH
ncbi:sigma-70 family RNA polymerase sigma factor [Bifidobacterium sp. 82T24]|uniref:Sigma-70 family RNA polymerase sigma factor n=1 Tax=Bifidobacterium saimiriisciurei TaxID=2661627 RepID=A0ABX0CJC2_9BIFI|nr:MULTISPECIES: sigma-70 family RNA polymerase sigma factor [Bifidobacterium]MBW3088883.1 sigma-70 family RNA polymerase sigma factor [Bifidobacterium pluvialisilvae]NEG96265.1 sigma-70 family RNA polymerase sigma factor [Bifidobacterium sp. SMB2]NEH12362.1 sigma-70 family RNA polymerase sigma factor [Bifidobacterium saimiriisciurei]